MLAEYLSDTVDWIALTSQEAYEPTHPLGLLESDVQAGLSEAERCRAAGALDRGGRDNGITELQIYRHRKKGETNTGEVQI